MFYIYYSNLLETQKDILLHLIQSRPLTNPFQKETILVQSPGMEQWLNWQIAESMGIASNIAYPMPASFIWQLYVDNLPNVEEQSLFKKDSLVWRLMRLLPHYLDTPEFSPLRYYLATSQEMAQQKCYQLSYKIADLFDQYLVYRPHWINAWEEKRDDEISQEILRYAQEKAPHLATQIQQDIAWQGILWRAIVDDIKAETQSTQVHHRASLHHQFLEFLSQEAPKNLPERLFIFGISALPRTHLETLQALSQYCEIHLFFTNGCKEYWGDVLDPKIWKKDQLRQRLHYLHQQPLESYPQAPWISETQQQNIAQQPHMTTSYAEELAVGHPLLAAWGKMGRDFLYLLTELASQDTVPVHEIEAYVESHGGTLLNQIQQRILDFTPSQKGSLQFNQDDQSLTIHSCYSPMREVEVLQDYLLHLFNTHPDIEPKDVVVMVANIDSYTPYIQAVFGQSEPYIPFAISDNKLTESDVLVASFLKLLQLKNSQFSAEDVLEFLDIPMIRQRFEIELQDLELIRNWVKTAGIRFGLEKEPVTNHETSAETALKNYNAWQAGLERILLGYSLREENGIWQDSLALDGTSGLQGQLAGKLVEFIEALWAWQRILREPQIISVWHESLTELITRFFDANQQNQIWCYLKEAIDKLQENVEKGDYPAPIDSEVITQSLQERLQEHQNSYRFTLGKMNFCTLLPMRSIPFKVVCLLGMNDSDYPRIQDPNSFDLMQFHHQKGDRFRRDDDRYLFLEALLSAQQYFYISYVGRSVNDDTVKEPSVLVNQLMDYLKENTDGDTDEIQRYLWMQHALNAFSAQNFMGKSPSFARKWLLMAKGEYGSEGQRFIAPLSSKNVVETIEIEDLIGFIVNPVRYCFEKQLGVYFRQELETIEDRENFQLDNLQSYLINNQLLQHTPDEFTQEWQKWELKGILPRAKFAEIEARKFFEKLAEFREQLMPYLPHENGQIPQEESEWRQCDFPDIGVKLQGNIGHLYRNKQQIIHFRLAKVNEKDLISTWLYTLFLWASGSDKMAYLPSYYIGNDSAWELGKHLTREMARTQLRGYIDDFILAQTQIFLLPSKGLLDFLKAIFKNDNVDPEFILNFIKDTLAQDENWRVDAYWKRLASQQDFESYLESKAEEIFSTYQKWFMLLAQNAKKLIEK